MTRLSRKPEYEDGLGTKCMAMSPTDLPCVRMFNHTGNVLLDHVGCSVDPESGAKTWWTWRGPRGW